MRGRNPDGSPRKLFGDTVLANWIGGAVLAGVCLFGFNSCVASCTKQEQACVQSHGDWDGTDCSHSTK